jgi:molecular chaperone GrpE
MKEEKNKKDNTAPEAQSEAKEEEAQAEAAQEEKPEEKTREQELEEQLKEKEDKYLRLCAEYDNFRKRSQKEKSDIYSSSKAEVIEQILPILDNFERAAMNSEADFDGYKKGVEIIFGQFLKVLEKFGVESFGEEGDTFDPSLHSAVMVVQDDNYGENTIAQVFSKGYRLGERIIREATVKVANT